MVQDNCHIKHPIILLLGKSVERRSEIGVHFLVKIGSFRSKNTEHYLLRHNVISAFGNAVGIEFR